jgi:EAL domain-containing protein (putative c-di-GMP-specific phosphodiesterase class I)
MIRLAHYLGIEVIAKGVEMGEQLAYLREIGCDEVQGFYCGRPLPPMSSSSCWRGSLLVSSWAPTDFSTSRTI